ncbi:hypothetical protein QIW52_14505 [Clostridioides difficile]|nr:hypothetical protein [Clostridioides difficile]
MNDYEKYPICDTDIWVNLCLGEIEDRLFEKYGKVFFVDVVKNEILRWKNGGYSYISTKLEDKIRNGSAIIIEVEQMENIDKKIIEKQLKEDAGFPSGFNTPKNKQKNMGEYMSAIIANHLGILLMKSNDHLFNEGEKGRELYPDLIIKNWNATVVDLIELNKRDSVLRKVRERNKNMSISKDHYENGQASLTDILKLKERFNNNF